MTINLRKFDLAIIALVLILIGVGAFIYINKSKISKTPVESENTVVFQVFFRGVTLTGSETPMKPTEETFITIRNVPHKKIKIIDVKAQPRTTMIMTTQGKPTVVEDVASPNLYDLLITVTDEAKITDDGAVLGGNKLKIGLPIILEGKTYRLQGSVSDLAILDSEQVKQLQTLMQKQEEEMKKINAEKAATGSVSLQSPAPEKTDKAK